MKGGDESLRIGIPRALLYYYYAPFWKPFFEELGVEVVISDETNKGIVNRGVREAVSEICVPIKIFIGHSLNLLRKGVDYIFVPRMVSISPLEFFCPKFMGLPDMLRHGVNKLEDKILTCQIQSMDDDISDYRLYLPLADILGVTEEQMKESAAKAREEWLAFRMYSKMGHTIPEALNLVENIPISKRKEASHPAIKIGVLGYVYNIYDSFVSMDVIEKLRDLQVSFITFDMLEEQDLKNEIQDIRKPLFWTFTNKLLGAGYRFFSNREVDGVIHITAFGCGPDSMLSKLFEIRSNETGVPFMMIRVDEHTGENHLQTRIEAFVDMLKRKKRVG
ncbi:acyl-CoA dehydratase activase-related protein [Tepidibacillus fermentans]|uniref:Putative nucleotide-binding protein (Sugar kinase/HSP70/actin superfamily) n=1 Tax=Tepidibacillus fermentans TaxID=1281767 RepID=A0A4R3KIA1_9BACI|nr:acyl-CoA dehydratase activase-related protein [Tepidibacillus fermentans]TCS83166.1 putative nucleotide-binding protein (sugar kinase/HSP70/actin superfamily) [Tepidibacillus fermentans]